MKDKSEDRLAAIRELVEQRDVGDQTSLVELLSSRYGIETNQTAVSRDLHKLGATKRMLAGKIIYDLPQYDASEEILRLAVLGVAHNESLIVVDTLPGLAGFVGDYLDVQSDLGVLGTIAGENALFVTPISIESMKNVFESVCQVLNFKRDEL
jgi:transcriptional regulator of arginine metabolism